MTVDQCQWPEKKMTGRGVGSGFDLLAQASKHLSERSPYDVPEDGLALGLSVSTLPVALASWLEKKDDKKRRKKSHNGTEAKKNEKKASRVGEKLRGGSVWVEHEDYFRRLEAPDLETLSGLASLRSLSSRNCFSVPSLEYESVSIQQRETDATVCGEETKEVSEGVKDDVSDEISSGGLEWILGCRNRILLTTERPSKKRRRLGSDAGLEKLVVAAPCRGNAFLCDFCCNDGYHHQLIVCTSCKATVHKKCYGVVEDTDETWLCSWCEVESGRSDSERPCSLCPIKGGVLKPVLSGTENGGLAEFAHLYCSLWMPEVYVEDLNKMEPILNLPGIKETRRKLLCNLCKVKSGACVRCCYATCRASFHPICAREAGNRLEIWGKHGCDTVELRAFCSKHSDIQESGRPINAADPPVCHLPSESIRDRQSNDETGVEVGTQGLQQTLLNQG